MACVSALLNKENLLIPVGYDEDEVPLERFLIRKTRLSLSDRFQR